MIPCVVNHFDSNAPLDPVSALEALIEAVRWRTLGQNSDGEDFDSDEYSAFDYAERTLAAAREREGK